nr:MAG TPA: hypothetical protein [Caudoviricetes sp.]
MPYHLLYLLKIILYGRFKMNSIIDSYSKEEL